jgi:hypothetical protein
MACVQKRKMEVERSVIWCWVLGTWCWVLGAGCWIVLDSPPFEDLPFIHKYVKKKNTAYFRVTINLLLCVIVLTHSRGSFSSLPSQARATLIRMTEVHKAHVGGIKRRVFALIHKFLEISLKTRRFIPPMSHKKKLSSRSEARDLQVL